MRQTVGNPFIRLVIPLNLGFLSCDTTHYVCHIQNIPPSLPPVGLGEQGGTNENMMLLLPAVV